MMQNYKILFKEKTIWIGPEDPGLEPLFNFPIPNKNSVDEDQWWCIDNAEEGIKEAISIFSYQEAAGGLVENIDSDLLFIYKRGMWDLPKGKTDPGEETEAAALREVREETSIGELQLLEAIQVHKLHYPGTFHLYEEDGLLYLKHTYWYRMLHPGKEEPQPEAKEGIDIACWLSPEEILTRKEQIYENIRDVLGASGLVRI